MGTPGAARSDVRKQRSAGKRESGVVAALWSERNDGKK